MVIMFICTGNIFRSMSAEHGLRHHLGQGSGVEVCSAGTDRTPRAVHPRLIAYMSTKGIDVGGHKQTVLTKSVLAGADLAVAMGRDHQEWVRGRFGRELPLFNQVCYGRDEPIPDVWEVIPDWETNQAAAFRYLEGVIDDILAGTAVLAEKLRQGAIEVG